MASENRKEIEKDLGGSIDNQKVTRMFLHEKPPDCKHPDAEEFDSYIAWTGFRASRKSPRIPGLSLLKRSIIWARCWHLIPVRFTQRLIDLSRSWEA